MNAMLLNEFPKEHREVQELRKQVAALKVVLQKVSAQMQLFVPVAKRLTGRNHGMLGCQVSPDIFLLTAEPDLLNLRATRKI